jgi:hypothetical protein
MEMRRDKGKKVGGHEARKLWRLGEVGMASRFLEEKSKAGAHLDAIETVAKIADVP